MASEIVDILYPSSRFSLQDQDALSIILKTLIWSGMLLFQNFVIITLYRAVDARKAYSIITALSLCVNIIMNITLIPRYSYLGASISMIVSEMIFFICGVLYIQKHICKIMDFKFIIKIIFSSLILSLVLYAFNNIIFINKYANFVLVFMLSFIIYSSSILLTRALTKDDISMIKK